MKRLGMLFILLSITLTGCNASKQETCNRILHKAESAEKRGKCEIGAEYRQILIEDCNELFSN